MSNYFEASLPKQNINNTFTSNVEDLAGAISKANAEKVNFLNISNDITRKFGTKNVSFIYRIKTEKSILRKMKDKKYHPSELQDILAGTFLCKDQKTADSVAKELYNDFHSSNEDENKLINFERKMEGLGKAGDRTGYQEYSEAYHMNLNLNGLAVEIQVMTKKVGRIKELAHGVYEKARVGGEINPEDARNAYLLFRKASLPNPEKSRRRDPKGDRRVSFNMESFASFSDYILMREFGEQSEMTPEQLAAKAAKKALKAKILDKFGHMGEMDMLPLPEKYEIFFDMAKVPGTKLIPMSDIEPIRARVEGIENALRMMYALSIGEGAGLGRRVPVQVKELGNGKYQIIDGNSTYAIANKSGWKFLPVTVE
jgi:hypothetical protein